MIDDAWPTSSDNTLHFIAVGGDSQVCCGFVVCSHYIFIIDLNYTCLQVPRLLRTVLTITRKLTVLDTRVI